MLSAAAMVQQKELTNERQRNILPRRYVVAVMAALGFMLIIGMRASFALMMTHVTDEKRSPTTNLIFSDVRQ